MADARVSVKMTIDMADISAPDLIKELSNRVADRKLDKLALASLQEAVHSEAIIPSTKLIAELADRIQMEKLTTLELIDIRKAVKLTFDIKIRSEEYIKRYTEGSLSLAESMSLERIVDGLEAASLGFKRNGYLAKYARGNRCNIIRAHDAMGSL